MVVWWKGINCESLKVGMIVVVLEEKRRAGRVFWKFTTCAIVELEGKDMPVLAYVIPHTTTPCCTLRPPHIRNFQMTKIPESDFHRALRESMKLKRSGRLLEVLASS